MRIHTAIVGILSLLAVAPAAGQQFPTVPDHTVIGRIGTGSSSGPSQAIPFPVFFSQIQGTFGFTFTTGGPNSTTTFGIGDTTTMPVANGAADDIVIGSGAGQSLTSGTQNVLIGSRNGQSLSNDTGNVLIGYNVAPSLHNGSITTNYNTAVGNFAAALCTTCASSVAIGRAAMFAETVGIDNTAVGHAALLTGANNNQVTAIGDVAGGATLTGNAIPAGFPNVGVNVFPFNGDSNLECFGETCGKTTSAVRKQSFAIGSYARIPSLDNTFWLGNGMQTGGTSARMWDGTAPTTVNSNVGVTLTCFQLLSGFINRTGAAAGGFTDTTVTAAQLIQCTQGGPGNGSETTVGRSLVYFNNGTGQTATLTGGTGVTINGPTTVGNNGIGRWLITVTNSTSGAEAVTITTTPDPENASNLSSGTVAAARGGAGTITGALKGNGAGVVSQAACADLSNGAASCSTDTTNAANITSGSLPPARLALSQINNSLGADVALNNTGSYFDGPSVAQGSTGTWFASGTVTVKDTAGAANLLCRMFDGATVVASGMYNPQVAGVVGTISLSAFITSPTGNIRIACRDSSSTSGLIVFNATGNSKDSTITAFRIN